MCKNSIVTSVTWAYQKRQRFIVPVSPKLLEAGGTLFKTSRKEVHIVSVDTFVSIIDIALGLAIMMAIYGNKIDNVKQCFEYCPHSIPY